MNKKEWHGQKGLMKLQCPKCKRTFITFLKEPAKDIDCRSCGQRISLDWLARFEYTCENCGDKRYGRTNLESGMMNFICSCGAENELAWNPETKSYTNKSVEVQGHGEH